MRQRTIGILQITAAGFCFGFLGVLGKWAYALGLAPGELLSLRFLSASAVLAVFFLATGPRALLIGRSATLRALVLGALGYAVFSSCYFGALKGLSVSLTVLLLYTYPVWVTLGERVFFGTRIGALPLAALAAMLAGLLALLTGELRVRDPFSLLLGLASALFYAAYILTSRVWLRGVPPLASSFYVMLGAGACLAAIHLRAVPAAGAWGPVLALAVVGTILPVSLFLAGLQRLTAAEASMLSLVEPCTGVAFGALFLGDRLGTAQGIGASVILAGLAVIALAPSTPPTAKDA